MKAVLQMEFAYLWSTNAASLATFFVMYVFLTQTLQTPTMVSVLCAMEPLLVLFTFMNADMANGWGRYRAALPLSRRDIVVGRYATILLSAAAALAIVAFMQPFLVKFDNAKGVRYATLAFLVVVALGIAALSQVVDAPMLYEVADWIETNIGLIVAGVVAASALALAISCVISLRIYAKKDL